jgi:4-amino-4-deoxy-L-arabinose transferase-like glycosyltransferase
MIHRTRFRHLAAISLLVLVGFFVRVVSIDAQSLWRDEVDALRFATLSWSEMLNNFTRPGWNGPLFYLQLRGWIVFTGTSEYALRFLSLVFGVLCLPLIYVLGRRLLSPAVGLISALLATTSPYLIWYSQEAKMYTLVLTLALLAIYSLRRALEGGGWPWWLAQIAGTTLAFYSHILAALLIPVQMLLYFVWWPQARKRWRGALVSLACLTLPYLPLLAWQAPLAWEARETGFYPYALNQMVVILLNGWSTGITNWGRAWGPALMGLLAIGGLGGAVSVLVEGSDPAAPESRGTGIGGHLALFIWLIVPILCVWLISLRQPLFTDRYLIWSAPAFYLLVAYTLAWFASAPNASHWAAVPLLGVILVLNGFNLQEQAATPIKSDFRAAAAYVASFREPAGLVERSTQERERPFKSYLPLAVGGESEFDDLIIFQIPYGRYTFDYYFPIEGYPWAEGLYTNHQASDGRYRMSAREAAERMEAVTKGRDAVWLVATEVSMWDERNLVQQWLDQHAHRDASAQFTRVDVYRYVLPEARR